MDEVKVCKKKKPLIVRLIKLAIAVLAIRGAVLAIRDLKNKLNKKMEEENEGNDNKHYMIIFGGKEIVFRDEPVADMQVDCAFSGVDINLADAEITHNVNIEVHAAFSGVQLIVPPMVRVMLNAKALAGGVANMVPEYEDEELPCINVVGQCIMSGINVKVVEKEEE